MSASIGIALSTDGTELADALLANADIAMYRAKDNGRNRYELFDATMQQWVTTQLALEVALRHAVRSPTNCSCTTSRSSRASPEPIRGFEALVRWERPGFGLVGPDAFIPTAEDTGLIIEIGAWVLEEACHQAAAWARQWPNRHLGVSVNVSSRQLANARHRRSRRRHARAHRARPEPAHARAHREHTHRRRPQHAGDPARDTRPGRQPVARRLRNRATRRSPTSARSRSTS